MTIHTDFEQHDQVIRADIVWFEHEFKYTQVEQSAQKELIAKQQQSIDHLQQQLDLVVTDVVDVSALLFRFCHVYHPPYDNQKY